jgi:sigma-B regulation protein RsbU (phosphoserine phosphatase)
MLFALLGLITIFLGMFLYINTMDENNRRLAYSLAKISADKVEADQLENYLKTLEKDASYYQVLDELTVIKNNNHVSYINVFQVTKDGLYIIYDTRQNISISSSLKNDIILETISTQMLKSGEKIRSLVTQGDGGWLCSAYEPIVNKKGEIIAITSVGIALDTTIDNRPAFLVVMLVSMWVSAIIFIFIIIYLLRKHIINPIRELAYATGEFITDNSIDKIDDNHLYGNYAQDKNEIDLLTDTIFSMEKKIVSYVDKLSKVTMERDKIASELNIAASIQAGILPYIFKTFPQRKEFDLFASMTPSQEIGGNFYDAYLLDDHHLGIVIADVSGSGVSTSFFKVIIRALINTQAYLYSSPAQVLTIVNQQLFESNKVRMFASTFLGMLDLKSGNLVYANAGHIQPFLFKRGKSYQQINSKPSFILAGIEGMQYNDYNLQMELGDRLFLYTVGLTEALNSSKNPYGMIRLSAVLNGHRTDIMNLKDLNDTIMSDLMQHTKNDKFENDIALLFLEFKEYWRDMQD